MLKTSWLMIVRLTFSQFTVWWAWLRFSQAWRPSGTRSSTTANVNCSEWHYSIFRHLDYLYSFNIQTELRREHCLFPLLSTVKSLHIKVCGCTGTGSVLYWFAWPNAFLFKTKGAALYVSACMSFELLCTVTVCDANCNQLHYGII